MNNILFTLIKEVHVKVASKMATKLKHYLSIFNCYNSGDWPINRL